MAHLREVQGKFGYILIKPNMVQSEDIPQHEAVDDGKTPSKRLRDSIFVSWKQLGEKGDFESYYRRYMDKIISRVQENLD